MRICGVNGAINGSPKTINGCTGGTTPPPTGGGNGNGLLGNYFNNTSLTGSPALSRTDATINFTWNEGSSPFPGVNSTTMSVRWEGQVEAPVGGNYTFSTNNDDATNLWVNGQQMISDWPGGHGPLLKSGTINLQAGQKYSIKLEFNQGGGGAQAQLLWAYPGQGQQIIPQGRLYSNGTITNPSTCGIGSGLTGLYSNSIDLSGKTVAIRNDAQINFTWAASPIPGIVNADGFSVRWYGQVEAPVTGNYTFKTNNDDGTRVWVNGQRLINDWNGHGPTWQQGSIYLTAGQKYNITIDYVEFWGGAQAQLYWEYPGQGLQLIPSCRLYDKITPIEYSDPLTLTDFGTCIIDIGLVTFYTRCNDGFVYDYTDHNTGTTSFVNESNGQPSEIGTPGAEDHSTLVPGGSSTNGQEPSVAESTNQQIFSTKFYSDMATKGISFTREEMSVIEQFPALKDKIRSYVDQYGSKPNLTYLSLNLNNASDEQIKNAIANLMDSGIPKNITDGELQLLVIGSPTFHVNLSKYYKDAKSASLRTIFHYGYKDAMENGVSVANSYKHAFFQIMHVQSFGRQLGAQLAKAHEENRHNLDNEMDYWNNERGLAIYDSNPNSTDQQFDDATFFAVRNGLMRYLKDGWSSTSLTPTNQ